MGPSLLCAVPAMGRHHSKRHHCRPRRLPASLRVRCPGTRDPQIKINYVATDGWIQHIRQRLAVLNGEILVEKAWKPTLQRLRDDSLMEVIAVLSLVFNFLQVFPNILITSYQLKLCQNNYVLVSTSGSLLQRTPSASIYRWG